MAYNKHEKRQVHSNEMKLRILLDKLNADLLVHKKAGIRIKLTRMTITMSYIQALSGFRNEVNQQFPQQLGSNHRSCQTINEVRQGWGMGYFGRNNSRTHGVRGRGGRGRRTSVISNFRRNRTDSAMITLTDGQRIEYHPSFNFPPNIFKKIKHQDIDQLTQERREYREGRSNVTNTDTQIQYLQRQLNEHASQLRVTISADISVGHRTQGSQVTGVTQGHSGSNITGGRN